MHNKHIIQAQRLKLARSDYARAELKCHKIWQIQPERGVLTIHFAPELKKGSAISAANPVRESKRINYEYMRFENLVASLKDHSH
jgi:hypothetical protein